MGRNLMLGWQYGSKILSVQGWISKFFFFLAWACKKNCKEDYIVCFFSILWLLLSWICSHDRSYDHKISCGRST